MVLLVSEEMSYHNLYFKRKVLQQKCYTDWCGLALASSCVPPSRSLTSSSSGMGERIGKVEVRKLVG